MILLFIIKILPLLHFCSRLSLEERIFGPLILSVMHPVCPFWSSFNLDRVFVTWAHFQGHDEGFFYFFDTFDQVWILQNPSFFTGLELCRGISADA